MTTELTGATYVGSQLQDLSARDHICAATIRNRSHAGARRLSLERGTVTAPAGSEGEGVERSAELAEFLTSLLTTFGTSQMSESFVAALSSDPGTLLIGTDSAEWWDSQDAIHRAITAQGPELEGAQAKVTHSEGWAEGSVGWGAARFDVTFGDGPAAQLRFTATCVHEGGGWKVVQGHVSIGVPNEEAVGKELTV